MSALPLKPALQRLGLRQTELARLVGVSARTVNQWASGSQALPGSVAGYLRLLEAANPKTRDAELARLDDRTRHLDEGLYRVGYRSVRDGEPDLALAVLRAGKISGCDQHGGTFAGTYRYDRARGSNAVHLTLGSGEAVSCHIGRANPESQTMIVMAGEEVEITLRRLGPLPD